MPVPPNLASRKTSGKLHNIKNALETPCKRRRCNKGEDSLCERSPVPSPLQVLPVAGSGWGSLGADALVENAIAECLALLEPLEIARGAMVCTLWCRAASGRALWVLAANHLGLARRVVQRHEISKRRSRGTLVRGTLLGESRSLVALRSVDLTNANAGKDDGILPSILREVSILRSLNDAKHPGINELVDIEVDDTAVHIATKYLSSSFALWFSLPQEPLLKLRRLIRDRFWQLFNALAFLHSRGIVHRNLTPSNVLLDSRTGAVQVSDYAYGRVMDMPLRAYSPEDPKLRNQSHREARRLWYRSPELLLRMPIYGTAVDMWSAGCMLAEAARGEAIFQSEAEIDHLFRVFQFTGTPGKGLWQESIGLPYFSPKFPVYSPVDMKEVARLACSPERDRISMSSSLEEVKKNRPEVFDFSMRCASVLGIEGSDLLTNLLCLDPSARYAAQESMQSIFLRRQISGAGLLSACCKDVSATPLWRKRSRLQDALSPRTPFTARDIDTSQESLGTQLAIGAARMRLVGSPASQLGRQTLDDVNDDSCRSALWAEMANLDASLRMQVCSSTTEPILDPLAHAGARAELVDNMISLASRLKLGDPSLHLGVSFLDAFRRVEGADCSIDPLLVATVCLKLADAFDEHSNEYYQRDKTKAYADASGIWSSPDILSAEKYVAKKLEFRFHRPTSPWFMRACVHVGGEGLENTPDVIATAHFISDLALFDPDLMRQPAALRAQAALLLSLYVVVAGGTTSEKLDKMVSLWNPVRMATCSTNRRVSSELCFAHIVRAFSSLRREWTLRGLRAVEERHRAAAARRLPSDGVPKKLLVAQLLLST